MQSSHGILIFHKKIILAAGGKLVSKLVCWKRATSVECSGRSSSPDTETCQAPQPHPSAETVQAGQIRQSVGGSLCKYHHHQPIRSHHLVICSANQNTISGHKLWKRGGISNQCYLYHHRVPEMCMIRLPRQKSLAQVKVFQWLNYSGWPHFLE